MPIIPALNLLLLAALWSSAQSFAHHGPTTSALLYNTDDPVLLEGEITGVLWRNPHVRFRLSVEDDNGATIVWELETTVPSLLERAGVSKDLVRVGDRVKVAGYISRFNPSSLGLRNMLLPDGREYAGPGTDLILSTERVTRVPQQIDTSRAEAAANSAAGIFRVWTRWAGLAFERPGQETNNVLTAGTGGETIGYDHLLTDEARAISATYDPVDHPVLKCGPRGMPEIMLTPAPIEIVAGDDQIVIHTMWPDPPRTVYMSENSAAASAPPTHLGYSVGRWENEDTLVVTTSKVNWPYFDRSGTPQSDQVTFVERFIMNEDRTRLDYVAIATDPVMFSAPAELTYYWAWVPGEAVPTNDCIQWED